MRHSPTGATRQRAQTRGCASHLPPPGASGLQDSRCGSARSIESKSPMMLAASQPTPAGRRWLFRRPSQIPFLSEPGRVLKSKTHLQKGTRRSLPASDKDSIAPNPRCVPCTVGVTRGTAAGGALLKLRSPEEARPCSSPPGPRDAFLSDALYPESNGPVSGGSTFRDAP